MKIYCKWCSTNQVLIEGDNLVCTKCYRIVGKAMGEVMKQCQKDDTHSIVTVGLVGKRSKNSWRYDILDTNFDKRRTNNQEFGLYKYNDEEFPLTNDNWKNAVDRRDYRFILEAVQHLQDHVNEIKKIIPLAIYYAQHGLDQNLEDLFKQLLEDDIAHASFNLEILGRFLDNLGFGAEYWRPIYQKRIEEIKSAKANKRQSERTDQNSNP